MATNIDSMPVNEKPDRTNYDIWSLKVKFLINNRDMMEFLTTFMFAAAEQDEHGNVVSASEQHKEKLKAYQTPFKRDLSACYSLLSCMHNNLLREFEGCLIAKDMLDCLKIRFSQISTIRLRTLCLKWMQFQLDTGQLMTEQL